MAGMLAGLAGACAGALCLAILRRGRAAARAMPGAVRHAAATAPAGPVSSLGRFARRLRARELDRVREQLPELLRAMAFAVRAGLSLPQAVRAAAEQVPPPGGREFRRVADDLEHGSTLEQALTGLQERAPGPDIRLLVAGLKLGRTTGGNVSPLLDRLAESLRERERLRGQIRAQTAQGRLSGLVVGAAPLVLLAAMAVIDPDFLRPMWTTGAGRLMLGIAAVMQVTGAIAIRAVVRIEA